MNPPTFVRPLGEAERRQLELGLRSRDAFALRRSQILLASAAGRKPSVIADFLGCSAGTVRNSIRAFEAEGLSCLAANSPGPKQPFCVWPKQRDEELRALLHQSPRNFGKPRSTWTLKLLAAVCHERGLTSRQLSIEAIRNILGRLGINWKRAKLWMTSPDPNYAVKKARRDRLIRLAARHPDWVLGFEDEVWWSRLARPSLHAWTDGDPMKVKLLMTDEEDPDPDAIACYGFLRNDTHKVLLRFVEGRPLADLTIQFLDWVAWCVAKEGKNRLIVVWDDASWHTADTVARWVRQQSKSAKLGRGVPITICELPVASPWLNNIEPRFTHAKKAILDPDRKLTAAETVTRVCEHFGCELLPYFKSEPVIEG